MQVKITEKRLSSSDPETGRHYLLAEGDIITIPDALGARWCTKGWAQDIAGKVPTGERVAGAERLTIPKTTMKSKGGPRG